MKSIYIGVGYLGKHTPWPGLYNLMILLCLRCPTEERDEGFLGIDKFEE